MASIRRTRGPGWTHTDVPDQDGRTFVVTGATGGLGLELTRALAAAGAHVVMAVRNEARGADGAARVRRTGARGSVEVRQVDVSDLSSVRRFAAGLGQVDVLVNNAGVMALPEARTVDGFEVQLATNHLGHFALANLLLPVLTDRVVTVSSASHRAAQLVVEDLNLDRRGYHPFGAYAQSKLANLLFLGELQRRLTAVGSTLRSTGGHPGYTATGIQGGTGNRLFTRVSDLGNALVGMKPSEGSLPVLCAATMDVPGNSYLGPGGPLEMRGAPTSVGRSAAASDPGLARALWEESERLTGVSFPLG